MQGSRQTTSSLEFTAIFAILAYIRYALPIHALKAAARCGRLGPNSIEQKPD